MSRKTKISLSRLQSFLKAQCDRLRAYMDASEYKDYIIALLFIKRINDQFEIDRLKLRDELKTQFPDVPESDIEEELDVPEKYNCYVPTLARWKHLLNPNDENGEEISYGDAITIALAEVEKSNSALLSGVLSNTKFNKINAKGERAIDDATLSDILKEFNDFPKLQDENFEFPDLLGAAYEYLIKFFAESAGKKAGEFYTPYEVVYLMGQILQPKEDDEICDPTVGSGGLLITMHNYVENRYGSAEKLTLHGQELKEPSYMMCKMNMIFHNIRNARIELGDTLLTPKLVNAGTLNQYDIVVANPPFSQNYTTANMQFKERFQNWMSKKKQADFMFVQHMISVLKNNGRMAVVMPHGVLFRGGEEQKMRERLIGGTANSPCILECVIGLPQGLFYGTGIPASLLIINKAGANDRQGVFFINADREYKEGKNQNTLRPEDIEKISFIYHNKIEIEGYSRLVTKETLKEEAYNCNIRRYVDNSEAPTPQDVKAHLNGGIPQNEIDSLKNMFDCYGELQKLIFKDSEDNYADFVDEVKDKNDIKNIIFSSEGKNMVMSNYSDAVDAFWKNSSDDLENLHGGSIFDFNNNLTERFVSELTKQNVLDKYQVRGSFAHFSDTLSSDFRSVQSSGWTAELIPDDELIANEFPEVLADQKRLENRRDELDAKFAEIAEIEPEEWDAEQYELMPKAVISEVKAEIKELKSQRTKLNKEKKALEKRLKSGADVKSALARCEQELAEAEKQIEEKEAGIAHHVDLENELKDCRKKLREIEVNKEFLADKAREQISNDDARRLICERWLKTLHDTVNVYLEAHTRRLQQAVELLYDKYSVTLTSLIEERKAATNELENYLIELGYLSK
ncbi:MAG: N-6 DNA methylase [Bacteroidales bacterium]|nr:N-6 DNA methylase [Bacteroidales bacterium]